MVKGIMGATLAAAASLLALGSLALAADLSVKTLTVGYYANPNPERIAQRKGWFDEALGLKVQWKPFESGAAMMAAITSGAIQFTCESGSPPIVSALASGEPMQVFWVNENAAEALAVSAKSGIKSAADLAGKKIGTIIGSTMYFSLVAATQNSGVPIDKVDVVNAPVPDLVAAYKRGDLDGVYIPYPGLGEVLAAGAHIVLTSDQVAEKWHYPTFDACVVNAGWAKDHGDVLTKWVAVENRAVKYYSASPADSYATIAAEVGITPDEAKEESSVYHFPTAAEQLTPRWLGTPGNAASSGVANAVELTGKLEVKLQRITAAPANPGSVPNPTFIAAIK